MPTDGASLEQPDQDYVVLPFLAQDLLYLRPASRAPEDDVLLASPISTVTIKGEGPWADGPSTARVAVVDTDAETGVRRPGARLESRRGRRRSYHLDAVVDADAPIEAFESDAFIGVSAFATVMRTVMFFEGPDALGRRIPWSCGPQLTVVPRAGIRANAFYDRGSASLRFFSFPSAEGHLVHAVLSHDVVSHETAHAVLDGIAPDLYVAMAPQSLAIHEAIADLAAIALTLLNEQVVFSLFAISGGQLDAPGVLSRVADEFGANARRSLGASYLRSASNDRTLQLSSDVDRLDPHALSEVLSGAVFSVFRGRFEELLGRLSVDREVGAHDRFALPQEQAVSLAARRVMRMVFRALDHLPPGELSLADVGRAIVASDAASGGRAQDRARLADEFVRRGIVRSTAELDTPVDVSMPDVSEAMLTTLLASDEAARSFVEANRSLLGIPAGQACDVLPRRILGRTGRDGGRRLAIRVSWTYAEDHDLGPRFGRSWMVPAGITLVLSSAGGGRAVTLLGNDRGDQQRADRDASLKRRVGQLRIATDEDPFGPRG